MNQVNSGLKLIGGRNVSIFRQKRVYLSLRPQSHPSVKQEAEKHTGSLGFRWEHSVRDEEKQKQEL